MDAFALKKQKKNIVDFGDMEHFALDILVKKVDGELVYTDAAEEFSRRFEEILIDEYQDSNFVQETLLQSVSRLRYGKHNIFMVGDVKQSIYKFRLARPELFMEKFDTYSLLDSDCQRIDLHKNFRSRAQVLAGVNFIFEQIMGKDLGDVEYDDAAALYPGAVFPPYEEEKDSKHETELLIAKLNSDDVEDSSDEAKVELVSQELEARMIGNRIREIVGKELVLDKATGKYRPARYKDCVILLRTITGWSEIFTKTLKEMGIPAYSTSRTGYFETLEIMTLLNYLKICDNPMQEIPFTGVLLSAIGGCTPEELAIIKSAYPDKKIYECVWNYKTMGENQEIVRKLGRFLTQYEVVRSKVPYTPIHELILYILKITGYGNSATAMPGGAQRAANLEMLVEKAMEFEKTSYRGLFNFCRYMEQLQKYQVDFGEVNTVGENEDTVRIMSIHKSKGLEFPIVFVAGMGKHFNMMDANAGLVIHPDLGIGMFGIEPKLRVKIPTLLRQVIQKQIRLESLGEELRVLYVALTRAKEKLILTGTSKDLETQMYQYRSLLDQSEKRIPYGILEKAKDFFGWILPAMIRYPGIAESMGMDLDCEMEDNIEAFCNTEDVPFQLRECSVSDVIYEEMGSQLSRLQQYQKIAKLDGSEVFDQTLREDLQAKFSYDYPFRYLQEIPAKVSVSELKHQEIEDAQPLVMIEEDVVPIIPEFIQQEVTVLKGAQRGTAYHRVMELLDYGSVGSERMIQAGMDKMLAEGKIDESIKESVRVSDIYWFTTSWIGKRMKWAWEDGKLWREQQFVMSVPASELDERWKDHPVLVQGIIDAFFEEPDGIVLVDYKTDYVKKGQEQELVERYQRQLWYYASVLERVRGKKVKEIHIYSFSLGKSIPVKFESSNSIKKNE